MTKTEQKKVAELVSSLCKDGELVDEAEINLMISVREKDMKRTKSNLNEEFQKCILSLIPHKKRITRLSQEIDLLNIFKKVFFSSTK